MSIARTNRFTLLLGTLLLLGAFACSSALASSAGIYQACRDGGSMSAFSKAELQSALSAVPADLDEYYGCSAQINSAILDKSVKNLPKAVKGVKGARAKLRAADAEDLTTPAEQKRAQRSAERSTKIDPVRPLGAASPPGIRTGDGRTLASSSAPGTPVALVIGILGLVLLLGLDLAGRLRRRTADGTPADQPGRDND